MGSDLDQKLKTDKGLIKRLGRSLVFLLSNMQFRGSGLLSRIAMNVLIGKPRNTPYICPTRYHFNLIINPSTHESVDQLLHYAGTYEAGTLEVIKRCLRTDDVFVDIGGYIGLMSIFASKCVGKNGYVYVFEPEPSTFDILQRNVAINRSENIRLHNFAIGSKVGRGKIYSDIKMKGSATMAKEYQRNWQSKNVDINTIDNLFITGPYQSDALNIRMMKIDVEGWELETLKGSKKLLSSNNAPILCLEYSPMRVGEKEVQLKELYNLIISINDYSIYKLKKGKEKISKLIKINDLNELPYHDNIFCFREEHLPNVSSGLFNQN